MTKEDRHLLLRRADRKLTEAAEIVSKLEEAERTEKRRSRSFYCDLVLKETGWTMAGYLLDRLLRRWSAKRIAEEVRKWSKPHQRETFTDLSVYAMIRKIKRTDYRQVVKEEA